MYLGRRRRRPGEKRSAITGQRKIKDTWGTASPLLRSIYVNTSGSASTETRQKERECDGVRIVESVTLRRILGSTGDHVEKTSKETRYDSTLCEI